MGTETCRKRCLGQYCERFVVNEDLQTVGTQRNSATPHVQPELRFFSLGPFYVMQVTGIPIGGPLSTMSLALALNYCEHCFAAFQEAEDIWDPLLAGRLRKWVYESGGLKPAEELYRNFRGKDPDIGPLLVGRGFEQPASSN